MLEVGLSIGLWLELNLELGSCLGLGLVRLGLILGLELELQLNLGLRLKLGLGYSSLLLFSGSLLSCSLPVQMGLPVVCCGFPSSEAGISYCLKAYSMVGPN